MNELGYVCISYCLRCSVSIWIRSHSRSFKTAPFDRLHTSYYQSASV